MTSATREWVKAALLLLAVYVVSSCASGPGEAPEPGRAESLEALLGPGLGLSQSVQLGAVRVPLPAGTSAYRTPSGAYRLRDRDGIAHGTIQFMENPPGAGLPETVQFVRRKLPEHYDVFTLPARLGIYDAQLLRLEGSDLESPSAERFILLVDLGETHLLLETDRSYAPLMQHVSVTEEVGSLRVRDELAFFAQDTGWTWLADMEEGILLHTQRLGDETLLAILPDWNEGRPWPFGLSGVPEGAGEGRVRLFAGYLWREVGYRSFAEGDQLYAVLELAETDPPALAVFSISDTGETHAEEILRDEAVQELFRYALLFGTSPMEGELARELRLLGEQ